VELIEMKTPSKADERRTKRQQILLAGVSILDLTSNLAGPVQAADILVENGIISRIAPHGSIKSPAARRLDARGCLILPGLTNAHTHSPENLSAGFCDGLQLESWLGAVWARMDHLTRDEIHLAVCFGAAQMLKRGVTAVVDHFRQTPMSLEAIDSAQAAYDCTGMRAMIAVMLRDRVGKDGRLIGAPTGGRPLSVHECRDLWTEVAKRHRPESRVAMGLGPSGPTRCTDKMFEVAVDLSRQYSLYLHTHVAETKSESTTAEELYRSRMVRHLDDLGFLGPRTSLAHCVWIDDEEIALISRSGAVVVHNPISNMALGSGIAPVAAMLDAKAHVAIGTDGAASNGAQDIFETIKCAALLPRCGISETDRWLTARQALHLAIDGGRKIFGLGPSVIAENAVADIAIFPSSDDALGEYSDPVQRLVYGAQSRARHVLAAGDPLVVDGKITCFDEPALQAEVGQIHKKSMKPMTHKPRR
jgi:5-methylthioadenosine/S-adenosylhomocysteine deaminase